MQPEQSKKLSKQEESSWVKRQHFPKKVRKQWEDEQAYIKQLIIEEDDFKWKEQDLTYVAGVDISFSGRYENGACSGLLIWNYKTKKIVFELYEYVLLKQDYIPGFLAFRQLPPTLALFRRLKKQRPQLWPQLILVDGNGILHRKRCGYASHLGVILNTPTIGCAKTFFDIDGLHQHQIQQLCRQKLSNYGENMIIKGKSGKQWCSAIMTDTDQQKAIFISIGNKVSLKSATQLCIKMLKYQIPEPIRYADRHSRQMIKKMGKEDYNDAKSYDMVFLKENLKGHYKKQ